MRWTVKALRKAGITSVATALRRDSGVSQMTAAGVENEIAHGRPGADLIDWAMSETLFPVQCPQASISESMRDFIAEGWRWDAEKHDLIRNGWYAFYRSQGLISPPIIQWNRLK
jgi:hypothetical protein